MVTNTPIFPQTISSGVQTIKPADTTTLKTVYTGGANGSLIQSLIASNTDTNTYTLGLYITISSVPYQIGSFSILAGAGALTNIASLNMLNTVSIPGLPLDSNGNPQIYLTSGALLQVNVAGTVATGKQIAFFAQVGDF